MKVSVICNTVNRKNHLRRLLFTLSKQTYDDFEVIVVNGPSEDGTGDLLLEYRDEIKVASCPVKRLGVSRNIGIMNAAGDICVFIDDDAVPGNENWIENIVECYRNPKVGGVGGPVYSLQGGKQFENGYVDVWGMPHATRNDGEDFNDPHGFFFNHLMGCNCSFRTSTLHDINGFDEFYDYFLDESDLAVRIIKAGYRIVHTSKAYAFHELTSGHIRKDRYHLDWYTIMKSQAYFGIMNSGDYTKDMNERINQVKIVAERRLREFKKYYESGYINHDDLTEFNHMWERGVEDGLAAGKMGRRALLKECKKNSGFKRYKKESFSDKLSIVMLCDSFSIDDPKDGIACYSARLAKDYAALGHSVHVVTSGNMASFSLVDDVNVHTVVTKLSDFPLLKGKEILNKIIAVSYEAMRKILQLQSVFHVDIVESPLWNAIGLMTTYLAPNIPMCVRLETPLKMIVKTQGWEDSAELRLLEEMETRLLNRSDAVLHISEAIKHTVEDLYGVDLSSKARRNYLGIEPGELISKASDGNIKIFFVGRLERRKGVHNLLSIIPDILEQYPDVEFRIAGDDGIVDNVIGDTFKGNFQKTTENRYADKVIFLGRINKEEKEKELQECDIFVAPSLYESFGIVFIEAMRYGKPVIGCAVGGMKEIIEDEKTGLLVVPDDAEDLKKALVRLISDPSMRIQLGENAHSCTLEKFNSIKQAEESIDIYRDTIKNKKNNSGAVLDGILQEFVLYRERHLAETNEGYQIGADNVISDLFVNETRERTFEFPWKMIRAGERVIIYGGGAVGRSYIRQLKKIPFCIIVAICDRNPNGVDAAGVPLISVEELESKANDSYDRILVAIENEKVAYSVIESLIRMGISKNKIIWNDAMKKV